MADEEDDGLRPPGAGPGAAAGPRRELAAWGCALLAGTAFAAATASSWLLLGVGSGSCVTGFPCTVYPAWTDRVLIGIVAAASGLYAVAVRALLRRPRPAGAARKARPPLWAALAGLTLFALTVGSWLAYLAIALLGRQL